MCYKHATWWHCSQPFGVEWILMTLSYRNFIYNLSLQRVYRSTANHCANKQLQQKRILFQILMVLSIHCNMGKQLDFSHFLIRRHDTSLTGPLWKLSGPTYILRTQSMVVIDNNLQYFPIHVCTYVNTWMCTYVNGLALLLILKQALWKILQKILKAILCLL